MYVSPYSNIVSCNRGVSQRNKGRRPDRAIADKVIHLLSWPQDIAAFELNYLWRTDLFRFVGGKTKLKLLSHSGRLKNLAELSS